MSLSSIKKNVHQAEIEDFLGKLGGKHVLDAGCGDGRDVAFMLERGFKPIGVDMSDKILHIAREKVQNGIFGHADITDLEFHNAAFDGILANCSLQYVPSELLPQTLQGFHRVLRKDGKLLVFVPQGQEKLQKMLTDNSFRVELVKALKQQSQVGASDSELAIMGSKQ